MSCVYKLFLKSLLFNVIKNTSFTVSLILSIISIFLCNESYLVYTSVALISTNSELWIVKGGFDSGIGSSKGTDLLHPIIIVMTIMVITMITITTIIITTIIVIIITTI